MRDDLKELKRIYARAWIYAPAVRQMRFNRLLRYRREATRWRKERDRIELAALIVTEIQRLDRQRNV